MVEGPFRVCSVFGLRKESWSAVHQPCLSKQMRPLSMASLSGAPAAHCKARLPLLMVHSQLRDAPVAKSRDTPRILQPESYKQRIRGMWEGRGADYDGSDTFHRSLAEQLVDRAGLQAGHTVLDLATGTGMVALPAAEKVGSEGRVVALDISTSMLSEAQKKAATSNLSNLEFLLLDAETAEFPEGTFDRLLCSSGMLYLQHIGAAVHRFHSWLKPAGEMHFNTPQEPCVPAATQFYKLVHERLGIQLADAAAPLATAGLVHHTLEQSGLTSIQVDTTEEHILYKDCDALDYAHKTWKSLSSNAIMTPLNTLVSSEQLQELEPTYLNVVQAMARPWETVDGVQNPYVMLWCSATKSQL